MDNNAFQALVLAELGQIKAALQLPPVKTGPWFTRPDAQGVSEIDYYNELSDEDKRVAAGTVGPRFMLPLKLVLEFYPDIDQDVRNRIEVCTASTPGTDLNVERAAFSFPDAPVSYVPYGDMLPGVTALNAVGENTREKIIAVIDNLVAAAKRNPPTQE